VGKRLRPRSRILAYGVKAFEESIFGPCTLRRTLGAPVQRTRLRLSDHRYIDEDLLYFLSHTIYGGHILPVWSYRSERRVFRNLPGVFCSFMRTTGESCAAVPAPLPLPDGYQSERENSWPSVWMLLSPMFWCVTSNLNTGCYLNRLFPADLRLSL
jgi:hypothetical protein